MIKRKINILDPTNDGVKPTNTNKLLNTHIIIRSDPLYYKNICQGLYELHKFQAPQTKIPYLEKKNEYTNGCQKK